MDSLQARAVARDGRTALLAPRVGLFLPSCRTGELLRPGDAFGALQILGRHVPLIVPPAATGLVALPTRERRRGPVEYGDVLLHLDPVEALATETLERAAATTSTGFLIEAPQAGRFYTRPAPDKPPFVNTGDPVHPGQPLGLIEVMKTFAQIRYGGPGLPERGRIVQVHVNDGDEVQRGQVLFAVEGG